MRIFTLLISVTLAFSAVAAVPTQHRSAQRKLATKLNAKQLTKFKRANTNSVWRPATVTSYGFDGSNWNLSETKSVTYDEFGYVVFAHAVAGNGAVWEESTTRNENHLETYILRKFGSDATSVKNYSQEFVEYDTKVTDFITKTYLYKWVNEAWTPDEDANALTDNVVKRDDNGNIIEIETCVTVDGVRIPCEYTYFTYGEDGKANKYVRHKLVYDYDVNDNVWKDVMVATNLVWDRTDGQMTEFIEGCLTGNNRLLRADCVDEAGPFVLENTYDGDNYESLQYELDEESGEKVIFSYHTMEFPDSYGSTVEKMIYPDEGGFEYATTTYDEHKNPVFYEEGFGYLDGGEMYPATTQKAVNTYDPELGDALLQTEWCVIEEGVEYPTERFVYSDFVDAAGVGTVGADCNATPEFFNLQGVSLGSNYDSLAPGLYVKKQGSKAVKIVK